MKSPRLKQLIYIEIASLLTPGLLIICLIFLANLPESSLLVMLVWLILWLISLVWAFLMGSVGIGIYYTDSDSPPIKLLLLSIANMMVSCGFLLYLATADWNLHLKMI